MYYWIGKRFKVEREDAPLHKCRRMPCKHYAKPNKGARRMLRLLARKQNSSVEKELLDQYDAIARLMPRNVIHPKQRRELRSTTIRSARQAVKPMFGLITPSR